MKHPTTTVAASVVLLSRTALYAASEVDYGNQKNVVSAPIGGLKKADGSLDGERMPTVVPDRVKGIISGSGGSNDI